MKKISCFFIALIAMIMLASCDLGGTEQESSVSYVTVEINPGIELVVDENNKIIAANGLNDDGKALLVDVEFDGITLDAALDLVIQEAENNGYLVSSNVNAEAQSKNISVSVTAETAKIQESIENSVKTKVEEIIDKEKLVAQYDKLQAKSKEFFEQAIMAYDMTISEAEAKAMSMEELLNNMEHATLEKAELTSIALEEYYYEFKAYDFQLNHKKEIAEAMKEVSLVSYAIYDTVVKSLEKAIEALDKIYYDLYVSPESKYLEFRNQINKAKDENVALSVKLSQAGIEASAQIKSNKDIIESVEALLDGLDKEFQNALTLAKQAINKIIEQLANLEKDVNLDYEKILTDFEGKVNQTKDNTLTQFEQKYSEELTNFKNGLVERKEALEKSVSAQ